MTQRELRKVMLISMHTCPSPDLQVPSFLCPFLHQNTLKYSRFLMTTGVLVGALHALCTPIPALKTSLQEIPSPMREAPPPAIQCALGAALTYPPGHVPCPSRPGTEQHRPLLHLTGSDGRWPSCSTAMLLNLPVLQEPPHCPELLQLQRINLVHSLLSTYPVKEFLNPRDSEKMSSPELLERIITPMTRWGTSVPLPTLGRDLYL